MSTIEPTEEQPTEEHMQAALAFCSRRRMTPSTMALARLLAEREAKLRGELRLEAAAGEHSRGVAQELYTGLWNENTTLRARVAELEARVEGLFAVTEEDQMREAQHLADIKALMESLRGFLVPVAHTFTFNPGERARALLQRLAHYDDALRVQAIDNGDAADRQRYQTLADIKAAKDALEQAESACEYLRTRDGQPTHVLVRIEAFGAMRNARQRLSRYSDPLAQDDGRHPDWPEVPGVLDTEGGVE